MDKGAPVIDFHHDGSIKPGPMLMGKAILRVWIERLFVSMFWLGRINEISGTALFN